MGLSIFVNIYLLKPRLLRQITRDGWGLSGAFDYLCVMFVITSGRTYFIHQTIT